MHAEIQIDAFSLVKFAVHFLFSMLRQRICGHDVLFDVHLEWPLRLRRKKKIARCRKNEQLFGEDAPEIVGMTNSELFDMVFPKMSSEDLGLITRVDDILKMDLGQLADLPTTEISKLKPFIDLVFRRTEERTAFENGTKRLRIMDEAQKEEQRKEERRKKEAERRKKEEEEEEKQEEAYRPIWTPVIRKELGIKGDITPILKETPYLTPAELVEKKELCKSVNESIQTLLNRSFETFKVASEKSARNLAPTKTLEIAESDFEMVEDKLLLLKNPDRVLFPVDAMYFRDMYEKFGKKSTFMVKYLITLAISASSVILESERLCF